MLSTISIKLNQTKIFKAAIKLRLLKAENYYIMEGRLLRVYLGRSFGQTVKINRYVLM